MCYTGKGSWSVRMPLTLDDEGGYLYQDDNNEEDEGR